MRAMTRVVIALWYLAAAHAALAAEERSRPIAVAVDASEAPRRILHARLVFPVGPGPLTLVYPKWLPGMHSPHGNVNDLMGLKFSAGGKPLPWTRDAVDMHAFRCQVPPGALELEVQLDFVSPWCSQQLCVVHWPSVLLYPQGQSPAKLLYTASLRLPAGWQHGSALATAKQAAAMVEFKPVTLETLADSPVLAGAYFKTFSLETGDPPHWLHLAADSQAASAIPPETLAGYRRLVPEAHALFGARHYREYHFLLALTDVMRSGGLEHHESSNNRMPERAFLDRASGDGRAGLLPHKLVHSWNGKYRRPAGLATADFQEPMKDDLLWVYEGLTTYLGAVLTARSGLLSPEQTRSRLAIQAARLDHWPGRTWRPLADTAVAAPALFGAPEQWHSWRRATTDFYYEGMLIWLEADVLIRQKTGGQRSLDDFCRAFHGGQSGPPEVKPYSFDDVVKGLNDVAAHDWREFFTRRLNSTEPGAPLGGVEAAGWRLAYRETTPESFKDAEKSEKAIDLSYSIGLVVKHDGAVQDVIPDMAAAKAGMAPGMKLIAVNSRKFTEERMREALAAGKTSTEPLELLAENDDYYKTYRLDYHEGPRYPYLQRDRDRSDLLSKILAPKTQPPKEHE